MAFYTQQQLSDIRARVDIVEVISRYTSLRRSGNEFRGVSPFADSTKPVMSVSPSRKQFKCWKSGQSGDVFKFIMLVEQKTFPESVARVAELGGIRL